MFIDDIYKGKILTYPLTDYEYSLLDKVWEFLEYFSEQYVFISDYRRYIINSIRKNYTPEEFLLYESIAEKMFWNLRYLLAPLWMEPGMSEKEYNEAYKKEDYINDALLLCSAEKFTTERQLDELIKESFIYKSTYYRSFINKLIMVDRRTGTLYTKQFEGSSDIFSKNYFNLYTMTLLFDRKEYESIMHNPFKGKNEKIELSKFYYQYDYGFPNLNYCTYDLGTRDQKMNRIKKLYYSKSPAKARYWFRLINN